MADFSEEFEPLFDYRRVQPQTFLSLDDDELEVPPASSPKRRKVEKEVKNKEPVCLLDEEETENEDWLSSPPKVAHKARALSENSTIKELRKKKQELLSVAKSAEDALREMEESAKRENGKSLKSLLADEPSKPRVERAKIVISIQEKDRLYNFRIFMDDKFERLFTLYAEKTKLELRNLVFVFDGEKLSSDATPASLGMEDRDIVEVRAKSC